MYRILRIINRFNLGGPVYNVAYLTRFLEPDFTTLLAGGEKEETEAGAEFIFQRYGIAPVIVKGMRRSINPLNDLAAYRAIKKMIVDFKPHIVHTHASKAGFLGRMAAFSCKVPITVHTFHGHVFHSYFGGMKTGIYRNIEQYLAARTTALIALSERQKEELTVQHRIAPAVKFHVIPLGFDLQRFWTGQLQKRAQFRKKWFFTDNELVVGIVGRLVPVKNHELFLRAFTRVKKNSGTHLRACIVGDGELKAHLAGLCKELQLSYSMPGTGVSSADADVLFTSWIKEADEALAGMDIVALSSNNEGTPVSLIEAQAAGKPIVSTRTGGIENVVIPDVSALLSPPRDLTAFEENLQKLVKDSELRSRLADGGRNFVEQRFNYTALVQNVKRLYLELLALNNLREG